MIKKIIDAMVYRKNFRKTYNELTKLSNYELEDIGIHRSMITRIAMENARKMSS